MFEIIWQADDSSACLFIRSKELRKGNPQTLTYFLERCQRTAVQMKLKLQR